MSVIFREPEQIIERKVRGKVKWFNPNRHFGFIRRLDNDEELYVCSSSIVKFDVDEYMPLLRNDDIVEFDIATTTHFRGVKAVNVTGQDGADVIGNNSASDYFRRPKLDLCEKHESSSSPITDGGIKTTQQQPQQSTRVNDSTYILPSQESVSKKLGNTDHNVELVPLLDDLITMNTDEDLVTEFLKRTKSSKTFDSKEPAVHFAVRNNLPDLLRIFMSKVDKSDSFNKFNIHGITPLHLAAQLGFFECVKVLMRNRRILCNYKNSQGDMPLHTAINFCREEVAEYLVECSRVDPTCSNDDGHNALHLACNKSQYKVVQKVLFRKPDLINVYNTSGFAPLHLAVFHLNDKIVDYLLSQALCNRNARISKHRDYASCTALHLAVVKMHPVIIESLVESGAQLNLTDDFNEYTPLHVAVESLARCRGCDIDPARLLDLQQLECKDVSMTNLLKFCCDCLPLAVSCYLLARGADCTITNKRGLAPFEMLPNTMRKFVVVLKWFCQLHMHRISESQIQGGSKKCCFVSLSNNLTLGPTCRLCNDDVKSNVRLEPCNHIAYCVNCVQVAGNQIKRCPVCDAEVLAKVGPCGEIKPKEGQIEKSDEARCSSCSLEKPNHWMVPKCGHLLCPNCSNVVKKCPFCSVPKTDLRQVFV